MARNGECIIMGDFYGHMGSFVDGFEGVHGGYGQQSQEDERILELADSIKMIAGNKYFKKDGKILLLLCLDATL